MKSNSILKFLILIILLASIIYFAVSNDISSILKEISGLGWRILPIIGITGIAYLVATLAWMFCFNENPKEVPFIKLFFIRVIGEHVTLFNPSSLIGGETFKAYLLQKQGIPYKESISSIILARAIMISSQLFTFIVSAVLLLMTERFINPTLYKILAIVFLSIAGLFLLIAVFYKIPMFQKPFADIIKKYTPLKWTVYRTLIQIKNAYKHHKKRLTIAFILTTLHWIIGSFEIYYIFWLLQNPIGVIDSVFVDQGIVVLKSFGAFIPGQVGVEEYANKLMFLIIGVTSNKLWLGASILRRARQFIWILLSGIFYLFVRK